MQARRSQVGWGFWLLYVLATILGMAVGCLLAFVATAIVFAPLRVLGEWLPWTVFGIVLGITVGILQWIVLRRRVSGAGWWVVASAGGGIGAMQSGTVFGRSPSFESLAALLGCIGIVALGGAVTGTLQWVVLKKQVSRAGWWVLVSTVCWPLSVIGVSALPWSDLYGAALSVMLVAGAVLGMVTGGVLAWLLRRPAQET